MRKFLLFITLVISFSAIIYFLIHNYLSYYLNNLESNYIETTKDDLENQKKYSLVDIIKDESVYSGSQLYNNLIIDNYNSNNNIKNNLPYEQEDKKYNSAVNYNFSFFPASLGNDLKQIENNFKSVLLSDTFNSKVENIKISIYKVDYEVRGKMKDKEIKLFGVNKLEEGELMSVFIHELCHHIDLYYLENIDFNDPSDYFYDISRNLTKVIKQGQKQLDFVSGYSMTNKYEDFAETCTYYVLHNEDFKVKSKNSNIMQNKYDFFSKKLFTKDEFKNQNFSKSNIIKDYYWDITKIEINNKEFLQYLK